MVTRNTTEPVVVSRPLVIVSCARLTSATRLRLGRSCARVATTVERAESSVKSAAMHGRVLGRGERQRLVARQRQHGTELRLRQVLRRMADEAPEIRAVARERAFGLLAARARRGEPRLGLRHVGAGQGADAELVLGRLELAPQHLLVVDVEIDRRLVAQHVEIGLDRRRRRSCSRARHSARARPRPTARRRRSWRQCRPP